MIHDKLNLFLEKQNKSAYQLAKETGLSEAAISRYRSGKRNPTPYRIT